jgi:hypothetical protein
LALAEAPARAQPAPSLDPLRHRFMRAGAASTEAVLVDFVEDDLRQAEGALGLVAAYAADVDVALRDPRTGRADLLALAQGDAVLRRIEELAETVASVRRRLAQIAARLPAS